MQFVTHESFAKRVFEKVREKHTENPHRKDLERLKAKIMGVNSQIDALSERLSELPKSISASPIYRQMEKLEQIKNEHEIALMAIKSSGITTLDRVVGLDTFETFAVTYRKLVARELSIPQKKQLLQKFVHKVEVSPDKFRMHFIVDREHYEREQVLASDSRSASSRSSHFFTCYGSNTLTFGPQDWT